MNKPLASGCKNPDGEYMCELCCEHEIFEANELIEIEEEA